jgi:hypothetical protein
MILAWQHRNGSGNLHSSLNKTNELHKKSEGNASISFFSAEPRLKLLAEIERCPFLIRSRLPVEQSRTGSSQIFKPTGHCHIAVKFEAYRNQNVLTQCYN